METKNIVVIVAIVAVFVGGYFVLSYKPQVPSNNLQGNIANDSPFNTVVSSFEGNKGTTVELANEEVLLKASSFEGSRANFYNVILPNGKTVFFFALRDSAGVFRAAANACVVCFAEMKGFSQQGDFMVCDNCGNKYPSAKIGTEKGGCNPAPISPNLEVRGGDIVVKQANLEEVANLFR